MKALNRVPMTPRTPPEIARATETIFRPEAGKKITIKRLFERLNNFLEAEDVVIANVGGRDLEDVPRP